MNCRQVEKIENFLLCFPLTLKLIRYNNLVSSIDIVYATFEQCKIITFERKQLHFLSFEKCVLMSMTYI